MGKAKRFRDASPSPSPSSRRGRKRHHSRKSSKSVELKALHVAEEQRWLKATSSLGSRSKRDSQIWQCECKTTNFPEPKLVFTIPKFQCGGCSRKYLDKHDLNYCLADVRVNKRLLLHRIFKQIGPECMANAMCQVMLMMDTLECINKGLDGNKAMKHIDPMTMPLDYKKEHPLEKQDKPGGHGPHFPSSIHKFIKMALRLKKTGIKLVDGTYHKIGDITFLRPDDHEAICTELANGIPLLAIIAPGVNFKELGYCQVYRPPLYDDILKCNKQHIANGDGDDKLHSVHMVVLLGPAFKGNDHSYWFANSHGIWCKRNVITEDLAEFAPDTDKAVEWGVGKVEKKGLLYSVVKLWPHGATADAGSIRLEDEDPEDKYKLKKSNVQKFLGFF